ncbi:Dihydroorotate dehydrogenase (quinone), mitochondrial [Abortiporus biennis]
MSSRLLAVGRSRITLSATRQTSLRHSSAATATTAAAGPSQPTPTSRAKTALYGTLLVLSTGLFATYYFDSRSAIHRYIFTPVLRYALDAETGHKVAVKVLRSGLAPKDQVKDDEALKVKLWDEELSNPVGLAAGFDKEGEAIDGLFDLGFSWVEIGSVTPKPQPGNPKPRVFHLPSDNALINRYGFPSEGSISVLNRLRARLPLFPSPTEDQHASLRQGSLLAVNLGKNKTSAPDSIEDFVNGVKAFTPYADVLVVNVSSPNTPGLRGLQNRALLEELLMGVSKARDETFAQLQSQSLDHSTTATSTSPLLPPIPIHKPPKIVLKIAPDLSEQELVDIAEVVRESKTVDGVIVSNTTIQRPSGLLDPNKIETGGLSGKPLFPLSLSTLKTLRRHLPSSIPLIGAGGISSGKDALEFAKNGARFVQVYTGFGYDGVGFVRRVKDEIVCELSKDGKGKGRSWSDVVNEAEERLSWKEPIKSGHEPEKVEEGVKVLIREAEELKVLLDALSVRIDEEEKSSSRT